MECQEFKSNVLDMVEQQMSEFDKKLMEDHIRECENCRKYYDDKVSIRENLFEQMANESLAYSSRKSQIMSSIDLNRYNRKSMKVISECKTRRGKLMASSIVAVLLIVMLVIAPSFYRNHFNKDKSIVGASKNISIDKSNNDISVINNKYGQHLSLVVEQDMELTKKYIGSSSEGREELSKAKQQDIRLVSVDDELILYNGDIFYYPLKGGTEFYFKSRNFSTNTGSVYRGMDSYSSTKRFICLSDKDNSSWFIVDTRDKNIFKVSLASGEGKINIFWSTEDRYLCLQKGKDIYLYNTYSKKTSYVENDDNYIVDYVTDEGIIVTEDNMLLPAKKTIYGIRPYKLFAYNNYIYALCYDDHENTILYKYDYDNNDVSQVYNLGKGKYKYDSRSDGPFLVKQHDNGDESNGGIIFNIDTLRSYSYDNYIDIEGQYKNYISKSGELYISKAGMDKGSQAFKVYKAGQKGATTVVNGDYMDSFIGDDSIVYGTIKELKGENNFVIIKENVETHKKEELFTSLMK